VRHLINNGAVSAPNAAPNGNAPISPPTIDDLPALFPKYCTIVIELILDRKVSEKPK
jgi:hypothetical protein